MELYKDIICPDFNKADIVNFDFGGAEISLLLPQESDSDLGFIAPQNQTVLSTEPSTHWMMHPFGFRVFDLVNKSWSYFDESSGLEVAIENFYLNLIEVPNHELEEMNPLSNTEFKKWLFKFFRLMSVDGDLTLLGTETEISKMRFHSMPMSIEDIECYKAGMLDWPMLTIRMPQGDDDEDIEGPDYFIYIPLTDRLFLYIDHSVSMIYRGGCQVSLPKAKIMKLKRDILMEILGHVRVNYSPEILALIKRKNNL